MLMMSSFQLSGYCDRAEKYGNNYVERYFDDKGFIHE